MPDVRYQNFDLTIQRDGEDYSVRVNSPAGQAVGRFSVPFSELELENFILTTTPGRRSVRRIDTPEVAAAKKFGERLFSSIFTGDVAGRFHSALNDAYRSDDRLRLRLRLTDVPELADLPWEYLYNPALNRFLALDDDTAVVRYLELPERVRPVAVTLPLKVLVAISDPNDYPQLDVEREWANLNEALGGLERDGYLELDLLDGATLPSLRRQLSEEEYHIFHFIGHGGFDRQSEEGVVVLKDEQGRGRFVSGQQMGWLMHNHKTLALAVLNACEGARADRTDVFAGTAQSLVQQGIPAVIAMQREITDDAAKAFAHAFYMAVVRGRPVEAALTETRLAIFAEGHALEWATPVLYMRASDGKVFDLDTIVVRRAEKREDARQEPVTVDETKGQDKRDVSARQQEATVREKKEERRDELAKAPAKNDYVADNKQHMGENLAQSVDKMVSEYLAETGKATTGRADEPQKPALSRKWWGLTAILVGLVVLGAAGLLTGIISFPGGQDTSGEPTAAVETPTGEVPAVVDTEVPSAEKTAIVTEQLIFSQTLQAPSNLPEETEIAALRFSRDSTYVAAWYNLGNYMGQLDVWSRSLMAATDTSGNYQPQVEWHISGYDWGKPEIAFFPKGSNIQDARDFAFRNNEQVQIRNVVAKDSIVTIDVPELLSVDVSPDGTLLATGTSEGKAALWSAETRQLVAELDGHKGGVESVVFSPSGALLATTEYGKTRVWDGATGELKYELAHNLGEDPASTIVEFPSDNSVVVICSGRAECGFWYMSDGSFSDSLDNSVLDLSGLGNMLAIGFMADRPVFEVGWENGTVQLWDSSGLAETLQADPVQTGGDLSAMALSSDGHEAAVGLSDGQIQIWEIP